MSDPDKHDTDYGGKLTDIPISTHAAGSDILLRAVRESFMAYQAALAQCNALADQLHSAQELLHQSDEALREAKLRLTEYATAEIG